MSQVAIRIGPNDEGRRMSLADFDLAEGQDGNVYELSRGVVTVMDVPDRKHLSQLDVIRQQLYSYRGTNPARIYSIATSGECKILLPGFESERHPDLAIYRNAPIDDEELWATWIPDIAIEIVSASSKHRDYVEKREEYFQFGILEYWIIDAVKRQMLVLRRTGGQWAERVIEPGELYRTRLLPGFEFNLALVFDAAENS
jgi:Uma2 family endonuclease